MKGKYTEKGGYFTIPRGLGHPVSEEIFAPENFSDEQKMISETIGDFVEKEIQPKINEINSQKGKYGTTVSLLKKIGELGFLDPTIDLPTAMLIAEKVGPTSSFAVSFAVHGGIGRYPLEFYGNPAQKEKYLGKVATSEMICAFAITEPEAGSDLSGIRTKATLSEDGKYYVLSGEKCFITNARFADLFTVLAKVDGDPKKFACLLLERNSPGLSIGTEEKKIGIKGSSTCSLYFDNAKVPAENLIGQVGDGLGIALSCLNLGRLKLAAVTIGAAKQAIDDAIDYAKERRQFGKLIGEFGLIGKKLAEMAVKAWAAESALYRTADLMEKKLAKADLSDPRQVSEALREYEIECALLKIAGSELFWMVANENVQIHGGGGYMEDIPASRFFLDARITMIYEGTSEINRVAAASNWLAKAGKNLIPVRTAAENLARQMSERWHVELPEEPLGWQKMTVNNAKKIFLVAADAVSQRLGQDKEKMSDAQEILGQLSDMMLEIYLAESCLLRAGKIGGELFKTVAALCAREAIMKTKMSAEETMASLGIFPIFVADQIAKLAGREWVNPMALREKIASELMDKGKYFL